MNSRIENGSLSFSSSSEGEAPFPVKDRVIAEFTAWELEDDDISVIETTDSYISYEVDGLDDYYERKIYFPDEDSVGRIKEALIFDEAVKDYIDPAGFAEFLFNCIDINAIASVQHFALLYDEPIFDEDGEVEEWKETAGRLELYDKAGEGIDDYAFEVGINGDELALGINWVERNTVIINIRAIADAAREAAEMFAEDYYNDKNEWPKEFQKEFEIVLVSTICHEFRHAVYELNELVELTGEDMPYPNLGGIEEEVEEYGNRECERLRSNPAARQYIARMINLKEIEKDIKHAEPDIDR